MFYLLVYAFMVMGRSWSCSTCRGSAPDDDTIRERSSLEDYRGLARRHPWAAGLLAVFMLALTGIPPLSGFWAKYYVFLAGIQAGLTWLVVVAVISSVISAFFYLRVLVGLPPGAGGRGQDRGRARPGPGSSGSPSAWPAS